MSGCCSVPGKKGVCRCVDCDCSNSEKDCNCDDFIGSCRCHSKKSKSSSGSFNINQLAANLVCLPGGEFLMGADDEDIYPGDGEGPVRKVTINPFSISKTAVSNQDFQNFVDDTDYVTEAENYGWTFVFGGLLPDNFPETQGVAGAPWWRKIEGGCWHRPEGILTSIEDRLDHPAIHISWADAVEYCMWAGGRLPTEAEWEYAARGGLKSKKYAWGDEFELNGKVMANTFTGEFPLKNTAESGYEGTAPVDSFTANNFGLHNMAGNVWEWCSDWFSPTHHLAASPDNPTGPATGTRKVMRGGSYLCHPSYCFRYRVGARSSNSPDASTGNLGFRVVFDV